MSSAAHDEHPAGASRHDRTGRVVGVTSAVATAPGSTGAAGSTALGLAIPSAHVVRTTQQLVEDGRATYPVLGVLPDDSWDGEGVRVVTDGAAGSPLVPGGPAERAGLAPGDEVELLVERDGRERSVRLVLDGVESD